MEREALEALIGEYIETRLRGRGERDWARRVFLGDGGNSFIRLWSEYGGDWHVAVRESVKGVTTRKSDAIARYRALIDWLRPRVGEDIRVEWPPVDVSNEFERYVYIMRALQTPVRDAVQYLSDRLWVSTRSVEDYLSALRYDDATAPNTFLGQSFVISGMRRANGAVEFLSSVHPILLLENLTCVVVTLQALLEKAGDAPQREWAMLVAGHVWQQLTAYAQGRVRDALLRAYPPGSPERARFEALQSLPPSTEFKTEAQLRREATSQLFYCWKAGERCRVTCRNGATYTGIPSAEGPRAQCFTLRQDDGAQVRLEFDDVLASERTEAED